MAWQKEAPRPPGCGIAAPRPGIRPTEAAGSGGTTAHAGSVGSARAELAPPVPTTLTLNETDTRTSCFVRGSRVGEVRVFPPCAPLLLISRAAASSFRRGNIPVSSGRPEPALRCLCAVPEDYMGALRGAAPTAAGLRRRLSSGSPEPGFAFLARQNTLNNGATTAVAQPWCDRTLNC